MDEFDIFMKNKIKEESNILERNVAKQLEIEDVDPIEVDTKNVDKLVDEFDEKDPLLGVLSDYAFLRKKILFNIEACTSILDYSLRNLRINIGPKEIEACGSIIKVQNDSSQELLKIHEKIKSISNMLTLEPDEDGISDSNKVKAKLNDVLKAAVEAQNEINKDKDDD